jgi:hypothetical protein
MKIWLTIICAALLIGCAHSQSKPKLTSTQAVAIARKALPPSPTNSCYACFYNDGYWAVVVTHPTENDKMGLKSIGLHADAWVKDSDGSVVVNKQP